MANIYVSSDTGAGSEPHDSIATWLNAVGGHTVLSTTNSLISTMSAAADLVIVADYNYADAVTIGTDLLSYQASNNTGIVIGRPLASGFADGTYSTGTVACLLGIIGGEQADSRGVAIDRADLVLKDPAYRQNPITDDFDENFAIRIAQSQTGHLQSLVSSATTATAGVGGIDNSLGQQVFAYADVGASGVGHRQGSTFDGPMCWFGVLNDSGILSADFKGIIAAMANAMDEDSLKTSPTSGSQYSVTVGIPLDGLGDLTSSDVAWVETLPALTTITVEAAVDGGSYNSQASGAAVAGLSAGDLDDKMIYFKITLATTDTDETPVVSNFAVEVVGTEDTLTATPTTRFDEGMLTWLTGANIGFPPMEVKSYDPVTQKITLYLKTVNDIAVGDKFQIVIGCNKTLATCRDVFNNVANFRGEPYVPGRDELMKYPDAH